MVTKPNNKFYKHRNVFCFYNVIIIIIENEFVYSDFSKVCPLNGWYFTENKFVVYVFAIFSSTQPCIVIKIINALQFPHWNGKRRRTTTFYSPSEWVQWNKRPT